MAHYVMVGEGAYPVAPIENAPSLPGGPWYTGQKLQITVPVPLIYELNPNYPGNPKALYGEKAIPIMNDQLVDALVKAGVDNIEFFNAVVRDTKTGQEFTNYKAFNIVGLVAAADMEKSTLMGTSDSVMLDADFDGLVIDEEKAAPFKLFRLAENISAIIVEECVKNAVENAKIPGMVFYEPGDWSG